MKKEKLTEKETFATSDIAVSAFLLAKGHKMTEVERNNNKLTFIFEKTEEMNEQIKRFWGYKETACPLTYYQKLRELKMIIHSGLN